MRKALCSTKLAKAEFFQTMIKYDLCVTQTFEVTDTKTSHASLNRNCCLLLNHLGVNEQIFINLMQIELDKIIYVHSDRKKAYEFVRRCLNRGGGTDDTTWDMVPTNKHTTTNRDAFSDAEKALEFLRSSYDLDEPKLQSLLKKMQHYQLDRLQNSFRVSVPNMDYFYGAPDPYGILLHGQVFIMPYRSSALESLSCITGTVLVSRNPMMHPGDIRRLEAVQCHALSNLLENSCGGIIFFSVLGNRSAADEMAGGDFDGVSN
jgi:hypothetical protein